MKLLHSFLPISVMFILTTFLFAQPIIVDHNCTDLTQIPQDWLDSAKTKLHIAYGHTSHGSQLTDGMYSLVNFINNHGLGLDYPENYFAWNNGGEDGALDLHDEAFGWPIPLEYRAADLGNPDRVQWAVATRYYLDSLENNDVNVIIWSWCGQVSSADSNDIVTYLTLMDSLEKDYPNVNFIYMTGHLDGLGEEGNLNIRNQQIRDFCTAHNKILYDFADIESYDPDGLVNYMVLRGNDNCDYDSDGNGSRDRNWADDWQNSHTEGVDWYSCNAAHSKPLNGNRKAYTAWWLWARIAGWDGTATTYINDLQQPSLPDQIILNQNYPNPFNAATTITFLLSQTQEIEMAIYSTNGRRVAELFKGIKPAGKHTLVWETMDISSGIYFCRLKSGNFLVTRKLLLQK
jgi:hypothetical protein